jgi:uncharacterized phage protein (TIGR02218 family)
MSRQWFAAELETVASYWRIYRKDGVAIGLTSHDRDLMFDNIRHSARPGMVPSAIRMAADLEADSAEVRGALDSSAISSRDLRSGRFDGAHVEIGLVDWETLKSAILFTGSIGGIGQDGEAFEAELVSLKALLARDPVPRTSPTCRAIFCGPGCNLSAARFTHEAVVVRMSHADNMVVLDSDLDSLRLIDGALRWTDGPAAGIVHRIARVDGARLVLDPLIDPGVTAGMRAIVREGCDHRLITCAGRFGNAVNFRGEPFLPGNDMLTRYPTNVA